MRLVFIIIWILALSSVGRTCKDSTHQSLLDKVQAVMSKTEEIDALAALALYELNYCNDVNAFDSLHNRSIGIAEMSFDKSLTHHALKNYLDAIDKNYGNEVLHSRIEMFIDLAEKLGDTKTLYESRISGASAAIKAMRVNNDVKELALRLAQSAKDYAFRIDDQEKQIESAILLSRAYLYQDKIEEAYDQLVLANVELHRLPTVESKKEWQYQLNGTYSDFFYMSRDWDEAGAYKIAQIEHLLDHTHIDSLELMWREYDKLVISYYSNRLNDTKVMEEMLAFANRHGNDKLKDWTLALYRNYLIKHTKYQELRKLYQERYPEELTKLESKDPLLHCTVMGFMCEEEEIDSSFMYYQEAERLLSGETEDNLASVQYRRLGRIYERHEKYGKARDFYEKSLEHAQNISNEAFALDALKALEALTISQGDYQAAYKYAQLKRKTEEKIMNWDKQKSILRKAFKSEVLIAEVDEHAKNQEKKARHARQNWLIAILLALSIIAMMMMTTFPVAEWVIEMMSFFTVLCLFEFVILTIDHELHYMTEGAPLPMFGAKVALLSVLFPLHHVIESGVISYMKKRKRLKNPEDTASFTVKRSIRKGLATLWPWLAPEDERKEHH